MVSVYATVRLAHLCAAEMQFISETDAAASLVEWGHFEHSLVCKLT